MDAALERAKSLLAAGGPDEAEAALAALAPWQHAAHAHVHLFTGVAHQKSGRLTLARAAYIRALSAEPALISARTNLVHVLLSLRKLSDAEAHAAEAVAREPRNADRHFLHALVLTEAHKEDGAQAALQRCVALNPRCVAAYVNLDALYLAAGKLKECRKLAALALHEARLSGGAFQFWTHDMQRPPHVVQVRPRPCPRARVRGRQGERGCCAPAAEGQRSP
jgi:tetratricopeptide (TPR) repeat protein